jgi:hypothetical protein
LFIVYSCPVGAVLVGALLSHIEAMPTQSSKKHRPYSNSEKARLSEMYDKIPRLSAQEYAFALPDQFSPEHVKGLDDMMSRMEAISLQSKKQATLTTVWGI